MTSAEQLNHAKAFLRKAEEHLAPAQARSQNMSELARRGGMSRDGLYMALSAGGNPTWSTIPAVTNALGLRFERHTLA